MDHLESERSLIRTIERDRLRALVSRDLDRADPLHADDFQLVTPGGMAFSKGEYFGRIADGSLDSEVFEAESRMEVRVHGDCAVIRYIARIQVIHDGTVLPLERVWHTDVYEQRDGQWQDVWAQATRISG